MKNDINIYKNLFADHLRELIGEKSVAVFGKETEIPERTIYGWLRKEVTPSLEYLIILSKKFCVRIDYLVGLED